ncbi:hypothetical protein [Methylomonas sp. UP202]|uniref:DUF6916 family protein n=1 Tax=Methylomonas sp. UP202 TaxID=3040943 RepID=UPI00247A7CDC|nr:hypothetical protein [Methylomonas sp. UP202]WGS87512.1 hypothetical protein QC632_07075 [Methylomonas sp. UP202]
MSTANPDPKNALIADLSSGHFLPYLGQTCLLESGAVTIATVLARVDEKPGARSPSGDRDSRMPFALLLKGDADCPYLDGVFTMRIAQAFEVPGIYLSRVLNAGPQPAALFQAVFN